VVLLATGEGYSQRSAEPLPPGVTRRPVPVKLESKSVKKIESPPSSKEESQKVDMSVLDPDSYRKTPEKVVVKKPVEELVVSVQTADKKPEVRLETKKKMTLPDGVTPLPTAAMDLPNDEADQIVEEALEAMKKGAGIDRPGVEARNSGGLEGSVGVRRNARTMTLSVPAPRGQITDRHGKPFAQSKVVWYPALKFGQFEKADRNYVISWARKRIAQANLVFEIDWEISDDRLWEHYRYRRWLAMPVAHVVLEDERELLQKSLMSGLILHPVYMRVYPKNDSAAHIVGYVGGAGKLEKGPINYGDPIFEFTEGRSGLEKLFDEVLQGKPGLLRKDYEADGTQVVKKFERRPEPGGTVVTTLDRDWQVYAEDVLKRRCSRGAFVVIDVQTGEVLTMASRPSFDLNDFLPYISSKKYKELRDDPGTPLFGRAFQGGYPPASTFKPVVALAALAARAISPNTLIYCPAAITIGRHTFKNWSKIPEGDINVKMGIARSCNTFFYQVGILAGSESFLSMARRLGYGSKSGLPLIGETTGIIPTQKWFKKHEKRRIMDGDTANLSIGQGVMLASPLQVAQAMAGIARGDGLPKLSLIKQIQDVRGRVLVDHVPQTRNALRVDAVSVEAVREGMREVVNEPFGTGKRGALTYTQLCGKTGTAQWGPPGQNKRLAWFAGFFPAKNPRFAFAALYEGKPGEKLSGGRMAAPMISDFFEHFKEEIKIMIKPPPKAMVIEEDEGEVGPLDVEDAPRAIPVEEDDLGLDPIMNLPDAGRGAPPSGFIPNQNPARPLTQQPIGRGQDSRIPNNGGGTPPVRAIPVEEDDDYQPPPLRALRPFRRDNRAVPIDE